MLLHGVILFCKKILHLLVHIQNNCISPFSFNKVVHQVVQQNNGIDDILSKLLINQRIGKLNC